MTCFVAEIRLSLPGFFEALRINHPRFNQGAGFRPAPLLWTLILAALLVGCGTAPPTSPPPDPTLDPGAVETAMAAALTQTAQPSPTAASSRPTLPATWTPTFTPTATPITPTATITPTSTPLPTLTAREVCQQLWIVSLLTTPTADGRIRILNDQAVIALRAALPTVEDVLRLQIVRVQTGQGDGLDMPGGQIVVLDWPVRFLKGLGLYRWTLQVIRPNGSAICEQTGTFIVIPSPRARLRQQILP
jgi:hypothetical protein